MNIITVNIDFEQGICRNRGISVVTGDYNSTKVVFDFTENVEEESAATRKVFEMKNPKGELVYADEIVNNEVILVGYKEKNGEVVPYSLFGEAGDYTFEVSLYGEDSKLTSVCGYITAKEEQVIVDGKVVETQITLFDNLMQEITENIGYVENLNVEASKEGTTTTITITKKDGTPEEVEILDGEDGTNLENVEIKNRDLYVTYGGSESDLGQVVPNIQIGTTTTGSPSTQASVVNVGTDLNPILNFTIPKGDAGAIQMQIVSTLPETGSEDIMYLVPLEEPESQENRYAEYVWIDNKWELLGKIGIQVDLTNYVQFDDYPTNDGTKSGVIKVNATDGISVNTSNKRLQAVNTDYGTYQSSSNSYIIGKGTLENVISGKGLTTKAYVDSLVGDIETILTTLDIGGGISGN